MALHTLDQTFTDSLASRPLRDEPNPLEVVRAILGLLIREKAIILAASIGCAVLAGIVGFLTTPSFTATSSFIPPNNANSSGIAAAMLGQLSSSLGSAGLVSGGKTTGDLYVGILKSQTVSRAMVQRFNLMSVYKVKKESAAEKHSAVILNSPLVPKTRSSLSVSLTMTLRERVIWPTLTWTTYAAPAVALR